MSLVRMVGISKSFGAVKALDRASFYVDKGEVVGLVGDNAAGKSTLMKILSGAYRKDSGAIIVDGMPAEINSPRDAHELGIEMIYQDLALANNLDIIANTFMGRELKRGLFLDRAMMARVTRDVIKLMGVDLNDDRQLVETLSGGQRQAVAIARALTFDARLVIMDEPTASLSPQATSLILDHVRQLRDDGISVVYISHRTDEVSSISDRVVIMSHGKIVDA